MKPAAQTPRGETGELRHWQQPSSSAKDRNHPIQRRSWLNDPCIEYRQFLNCNYLHNPANFESGLFVGTEPYEFAFSYK